LFSDFNTATIILSPYGNADLQEKLLRYLGKNENLYWIYPHRRDDKTAIDERFNKQLFSIVVEE
jgi:hypothetical protein